MRSLSAALLAALALAPAAAAEPGEISTVAGTGEAGYGGEGVAATAAKLDGPVAVAPLPGGGFLISERGGSRVRLVTGPGEISTVAGLTSGQSGYNGDGSAATAAELNHPQGIVALAGGGFLIADSDNHRVREVDAAGTIATVAGTGEPGYSGDELFATTVKVDHPVGVSPWPDGGFLIAQDAEARVRRVYSGGVIETLSEGGFNGPTPFAEPQDVAAAPDGSMLVAEGSDNRIRRYHFASVAVAAGTGSAGFSGDGSTATEATLRDPHGVSPAPDGGFLIADTGNNRIRRVAPGGAISTVAGNGTNGFAGDGEAAAMAKLSLPARVAASPDGGFLIADTGNQRIRYVEGPSPPRLKAAPPRTPANDNTPRMRGAAPSGSTVYLFDSPACSGVPVAHGTAAAFAAAGIEAEVLDDTSTRYSAVAEHGGIDSACSGGSVTYTEDSSPPQTRVRNGPPARTRLRSATFILAAVPPATGTSFRCALDARPLRRCPQRVSFQSLRAGPHRFRALAVDAAGNADRSPARRRFRVLPRRRWGAAGWCGSG
jgi:NHL repeat